MEVKVEVAKGNTPNIFVWVDGKLVAKLWIYPDGQVRYRTFYPETTAEILLLTLKKLRP